jgi:hypothetical protein
VTAARKEVEQRAMGSTWRCRSSRALRRRLQARQVSSARAPSTPSSRAPSSTRASIALCACCDDAQAASSGVDEATCRGGQWVSARRWMPPAVESVCTVSAASLGTSASMFTDARCNAVAPNNVLSLHNVHLLLAKMLKYSEAYPEHPDFCSFSSVTLSTLTLGIGGTLRAALLIQTLSAVGYSPSSNMAHPRFSRVLLWAGGWGKGILGV